MAQQRERAVADEVHGRLVAGDVEQDHLLDELVLGEPVAFVLGRDQRGEQVVAGLRALPRRSISFDVGSTMLSLASNAREHLLAA